LGHNVRIKGPIVTLIVGAVIALVMLILSTQAKTAAGTPTYGQTSGVHRITVGRPA
jgi:hypothetical protein